MTLSDLENTRSASKASNSPAWKKFTGEMYKKTVLHRLCKHIELDFENPTQQTTFYSGVEIETNVEDEVKADIEAHANKEEFIPEPMAIEEQPKQPTVAEAVKTAEKEPVPAAVAEPEIPDFMKQEEM